MVETQASFQAHVPLDSSKLSGIQLMDQTRRRKIEHKCLDLKLMLESQGTGPEEIAHKVLSFRSLLTRQSLGDGKKHLSSGGSLGTITPERDLERALDPKDRRRSDSEAGQSSKKNRKKKRRKKDRRKKRRHRSRSSSYSRSRSRSSRRSTKRTSLLTEDNEDLDEYSDKEPKKSSRRKKKSRSKSRSHSRGRSRHRSNEKRKKKKKHNRYSLTAGSKDEIPVTSDPSLPLGRSPSPKLRRFIPKPSFNAEDDVALEHSFTSDAISDKQIVISSIDDIPTLDDEGNPVARIEAKSSLVDIVKPVEVDDPIEKKAWDSPELPNSNGFPGASGPVARNLKFPKFLPKIIDCSILNNNNGQRKDEAVEEGPRSSVEPLPRVESKRERKKSWSRSRSRSRSYSAPSRSSSRYSRSRSRSGSRSHYRSSRSRSCSRSYSTSRSRTRSRTRSPSLPRRTGSPSFKERRRITSARKRPIPYRRKPSHWGGGSSDSESSYESRSRSRSWSRSQSRSRSPR